MKQLLIRLKDLKPTQKWYKLLNTVFTASKDTVFCQTNCAFMILIYMTIF